MRLGSRRIPGTKALSSCIQLLAAGLLNLQRVGLLTEVSEHSGVGRGGQIGVGGTEPRVWEGGKVTENWNAAAPSTRKPLRPSPLRLLLQPPTQAQLACLSVASAARGSPAQTHG